MTRPLNACLLLLCLCLGAACGTKATVKRMMPARFPVSTIKRLAIAPFTTASLFSQRGWRISEQIEEALARESFYEIVSRAPRIGADVTTGEFRRLDWKEWGKQNRVDGILAGTIVGARVHLHRSRRRIEEKERTGRYRQETYTEGGQVKTRQKEIVRTRVRYEPILEKRARLEVTVALLDVQSGHRLTRERYVEEKRERAEGDRIRSLPDDDEMIEKLARKIVTRIVDDLTPHPATEKIAFAQDAECKEGIRLAKKGHWDEAMASWQAVRAANPHNHAASYNLGLAFEARGNYAQAAKAYGEALRLHDVRRYHTALARIEERLEEKSRLEEQLEGR